MELIRSARILGLFFIAAAALTAQQKGLPGSEECAGCHQEGKRTGRREAGMPPPFDAAGLRASPHAALECSNCHAAADPKKLPHADKLPRVDCGGCHSDQQGQYSASLHGTAAKRGDKLAPTCSQCHGTHDILRSSDPKSITSTIQVPRLCGKCHHEGSPVSLTHDIPQSHILSNYSESIHGQGLFTRGLTVTAVCSSCHTAHFVLPHTDPRSSISKQNIAKTCTKCHAQIETVHQKVIRGELWEKKPHVIPACVDCHEPHKIRRVFYAQGMSDRDCLKCHGSPDLKMTRGGQTVSLFVKTAELSGSRHSRTACVQCHTGVTPSQDRPCATVIEKVDCSVCHEQVVGQYRESTHGLLAAKGSPDAPLCRDCHGTHGVLSKNQSNSPTFSRNVPTLCAQCHRTGQKAAIRNGSTQTEIVEHYRESIHGKGLLEAGLTVTADCADCHTPHHELPKKDPRSTVNPANITSTCGKCHRGIYEQFANSIHAKAGGGKQVPRCADCHSAHSIQRTDISDFRLHIMDQCGRCHKEITDRYFETYHGKVSRLGYLKTAKCYDCHGAHDVQKVDDARSRLSRANIVKTCAKCHPGSNRRFAGYLTHATHHDPQKYPFLFATFWGMTALLIGTLVIAGTHTIAWLPRSLQFRRQLQAEHAGEGNVYVRRFHPRHRNMHLTVISSFFGLAITGMMLKFSYAPWAQWVARLLGGFEAAGMLHRACAAATFGYFGFHLFDLLRQKRGKGIPWKNFIFSEESMLFNRRDWHEFVASVKWFFGRGPRPEYGRWTYWEKFDYFAVFWGVAVIGTTGLLLWFPTFFTRILPGWALNVATTIHSDEALLAVGFIFTIHFFNTHFRPEKFPIDTVIFTGGMPLEEFKRDRPREHQDLVDRGVLENYLMPAPIPIVAKFWRRLGYTALTIGLLLIALILYAEIIAYR